MKSMVEQLRIWLQSDRVQSLVPDSELTPTQDASPKLPPILHTHLEQKIQALASHPVYVDTIRSKISDAVDGWLQGTASSNCLVLLSHPVEALAVVLEETLTNWVPADLTVQQLEKQWISRPHQHDTVRPKLAEALGAIFPVPPLSTDSVHSSQTTPTLTILPHLDRCFLRCTDGLDGVEYIRDTILQDQSRFWLLSCNQWAWHYLNKVCQMGGCFEQTVSLPALTGSDIRDWLASATDRVALEFGSVESFASGLSKATDTDSWTEADEAVWSSRSEKKYFDQLAKMSLGSSQVAAQLWLRSLHCSPPQAQEGQTADESDALAEGHSGFVDWSWPQDQPVSLEVRRAQFPSLPSLTPADRYVLVSLLLHGRMSLMHLALSLGETLNQIRGQICPLERNGVVMCNQGMWAVAPAYYLSLKADLERNNFLIGDDL